MGGGGHFLFPQPGGPILAFKPTMETTWGKPSHEPAPTYKASGTRLSMVSEPLEAAQTKPGARVVQHSDLDKLPWASPALVRSLIEE